MKKTLLLSLILFSFSASGQLTKVKTTDHSLNYFSNDFYSMVRKTVVPGGLEYSFRLEFKQQPPLPINSAFWSLSPIVTAFNSLTPTLNLTISSLSYQEVEEMIQVLAVLEIEAKEDKDKKTPINNYVVTENGLHVGYMLMMDNQGEAYDMVYGKSSYGKIRWYMMPETIGSPIYIGMKLPKVKDLFLKARQLMAGVMR